MNIAKNNWVLYFNTVYRDGASKNQEEQLRQAFHAGQWVMFQTFQQLAIKTESEDEACIALNELEAELKTELKLGLDPNQPTT